MGGVMCYVDDTLCNHESLKPIGVDQYSELKGGTL